MFTLKTCLQWIYHHGRQRFWMKVNLRWRMRRNWKWNQWLLHRQTPVSTTSKSSRMGFLQLGQLGSQTRGNHLSSTDWWGKRSFLNSTFPTPMFHLTNFQIQLSRLSVSQRLLGIRSTFKQSTWLLMYASVIVRVSFSLQKYQSLYR